MYRISLPSSLFLTFGGQCLSYPWCKYGEIPLRSPQKLSYTYWKFCSTSLSLYPLVGAWWWSAPSLTQNLPCIWVQGQYHPWGKFLRLLTLMDEKSHVTPIINNQFRSMTLAIILQPYQVIQGALSVLLKPLTLSGKYSSIFIMHNGSHSMVLGREKISRSPT